jgi:hypothetical protein
MEEGEGLVAYGVVIVHRCRRRSLEGAS